MADPIRLASKDIYRGSSAALQAAPDLPWFRSVLSLQRWEHDPQMEGRVLCTVPLGVWRCPNESELQAAAVLMTVLPKPLFVHCRKGVDRTGAAVAYYRVMVDRINPYDAIDEMLAAGFHRYRYFYWLPELKEILSHALYDQKPLAMRMLPEATR